MPPRDPEPPRRPNDSENKKSIYEGKKSRKGTPSSPRSAEQEVRNKKRDAQAEEANIWMQISEINSDRAVPGSLVPAHNLSQMTNTSGSTPVAENGGTEAQVPVLMITPAISITGPVTNSLDSPANQPAVLWGIIQNIPAGPQPALGSNDTSMPPPAAREGNAPRAIRFGNTPKRPPKQAENSQGSVGIPSGMQSASASSQVSENQPPHQVEEPFNEPNPPHSQTTESRRLSVASTAAASTKRSQEPSSSDEPDKDKSASSSRNASRLSSWGGSLSKNMSKFCGLPATWTRSTKNQKKNEGNNTN